MAADEGKMAHRPVLAAWPDTGLCRGPSSRYNGSSPRETSMSGSSGIQARNRELAARINAEARANPNSPYAGKFVGIANAQVVVVADSWDDVVRELQRVESEPQNTFCLEA